MCWSLTMATPPALPGRASSRVTTAIDDLGLRGQRPDVVVVGGAAGLDQRGKERLGHLFSDALLTVLLAR
jgi:hypothetical protein